MTDILPCVVAVVLASGLYKLARKVSRVELTAKGKSREDQST